MGKPQWEHGSGLSERWAAACRHCLRLGTWLSLEWGLSCCWRSPITVWWVSWLFMRNCDPEFNTWSAAGHLYQLIPSQTGSTGTKKMRKNPNEIALRTCLHASSTLNGVFRDWRTLKISYSWDFTGVLWSFRNVAKNLMCATLCFLLCLSSAVRESRFLSLKLKLVRFLLHKEHGRATLSLLQQT